jgi:hypothetical protein
MDAAARKRILLAVLTLGSLVAVFFLKPLPQPGSYHDFADQRTLLGIPHFMDVASNLPFLVAGLYGLYNAASKKESAGWLVLGLSVFLTCFGSSYYHWAPSDAALFWDRLPMALGFSALLAIMLQERVTANMDGPFLPLILAAGVGSLLYWRWQNDLRFYFLLQAWAVLLVPLILGLFPDPYRGTGWLWLGIGFYALSKMFELLDRPIYSAFGFVSGHSLKHLAAGVGSWYLFVHLKRRSPA